MLHLLGCQTLCSHLQITFTGQVTSLDLDLRWPPITWIKGQFYMFTWKYCRFLWKCSMYGIILPIWWSIQETVTMVTVENMTRIPIMRRQHAQPWCFLPDPKPATKNYQAVIIHPSICVAGGPSCSVPHSHHRVLDKSHGHLDSKFAHQICEISLNIIFNTKFTGWPLTSKCIGMIP